MSILHSIWVVLIFPLFLKASMILHSIFNSGMLESFVQDKSKQRFIVNTRGNCCIYLDPIKSN